LKFQKKLEFQKKFILNSKKWRKKIGIPKKNSYEIPNSEGKNWNL